MTMPEFDTEKLLSLLRFEEGNPLLFNSGMFLILFCGFILIYQLMRKVRVAKMLFVILFSLYFYYKSSAEYCFILLGVCVSDYLLGILLGDCTRTWQRKGVVWINVLMNVGMLVYFKYLNLIYETVCNFASVEFNALDIVLPAGISFFTFRSISYIVDIYRKQIEPCRDFISYTFFLTFFPPLLAGPVVRAKDLLPQIASNPTADRAMMSEGFFLIMCGLVKKVVIADFISQNFVDRIFDNPSLYSGFENLMGMYGFFIQLYCDFSGYTDMAIGIALLLGFRFPDNFRAPFKAQNPTEFWHRWHISLSSWLRDYVYIPLGGNRCGKIRRNANLMATMLIGGLWHGASWMYMIWGGLQGVFLVGHKVLSGDKHKRNSEPATGWRMVFNVFVTFNLLAISFMIFRAHSMQAVCEMGTQIFTDFHLSVAPQFIEGYLMIVLVMIGALLMHFLPTKWTENLIVRYSKFPILLQAFVLVIVIFIVIQARQSDIMPFIYFQY